MRRPDEFAREVWAGGGGAAGTALRLALTPAEAAYGAITRARNGAYDRGWLRSERADVPVISIGNISVGGAGKTPFAAWVARRLLEWGREPAIVLRGYGEDEILLHRELTPKIPVFPHKRRVEAALEAFAMGCDVVVLDDGFQHRALARDLDIVLVPVEGWEPRPRLVPRGPWREGPRALGRADVIVLTRKSADAARAAASTDAVPLTLSSAPAPHASRCAPTTTHSSARSVPGSHAIVFQIGLSARRSRSSRQSSRRRAPATVHRRRSRPAASSNTLRPTPKPPSSSSATWRSWL